MRQLSRSLICAFAVVLTSAAASAQPQFINGLVIPGNAIDATRLPGANGGRLGFFSDIYYDPQLNQWWALSDRGPGGGLLRYETRLQRFAINAHPVTGRISEFRVLETVLFTDPEGLLDNTRSALDGLNPRDLNGNVSALGRSFDPEGLVIDPRTGHFIVADEYGPSVYEFDRKGRLVKVFEVPTNLIPKTAAGVDYVATRDDGANAGRQDNRGYEGLAITPDGNTLYAVLQDPLINEPSPNNGRNSRNVRLVQYDNDPDSPSYGRSTAQFVYQLELQSAVAERINAQLPGDATATDPRQGRNIGVSAIVAINDTEFFVLERDNRGIGVDDPAGARAVGSKQVFRISLEGATDVSEFALGLTLPVGVVPVTKSGLVINLAATTMLPNNKHAEKWEGLAIGPQLVGGDFLILSGNDNDYSVTQTGAGEQFDVYVNFAGQFARCVLDDPTRCEVNPATGDLVIDNPIQLPEGFALLPGVLHAYRASPADVAGYVEPGRHSD